MRTEQQVDVGDFIGNSLWSLESGDPWVKWVVVKWLIAIVYGEQRI